MDTPITVVIADDHGLVRRGTREILEQEPTLRVVGEAASGAELVDVVAARQPDVALVDIGMPDMSGIEALEQIKAKWPHVAVLVLSIHDDIEYVWKAIQAGASPVAFLAVRPPGHHAHRARALGFCIFNNIAITTERLVIEGARVAIVDYDVHHGDGTQDTFGSRSDVLYVSLHEYPFYPGSGWLEEVGHGQGHGRTVNVPLPPGTAGDAIELAFQRIVVPVVGEFAPDWVLVSAGYDGHRADPLADWVLEADDYGRMARHLSRFDVPVVYFLEGGYEYDAIVSSVASTIRGAAGTEFPAPTGTSPPAAMEMVRTSAVQAALHWSSVQAG